MKHSCFTSLVAAGVSLFVSVHAHAQPIFVRAQSIEYIVNNADIVVIGKVVDFAGEEKADQFGRREATIAIEETLKGEYQERMRVLLAYPVRVLAEWQDDSRRLLVAAQGVPLIASQVISLVTKKLDFLTEDHRNRLLVAANKVPPAATDVIDLTKNELEVLTADFRVLREPEEVLRIAKETIRRRPGVRRVHGFRLMVPPEVVAETKWRTSAFLTVPVDDRLQKRAHDYIRSESYQQRCEGAEALRYFKSQENIARVKPLLADPGWGYLRRAEENQGIEVRMYGVREEAYQTLKYWGVNAEKPMIRERIEKLGSVKLVDLSNRDVTDADLKELERFENLEQLYLWNSQLTNASLKQLARLKSLQEVDLSGTPVTAEGVAELRKLRPNLKIQR